jgi:hypothetical protein
MAPPPPPAPGAAGAPAAYPLPVPVPQPAANAASGAKKRPSLFASLRGVFGSVSPSSGAGLSAKLRGLFKSSKTAPRPKPPAPPQRAERPVAPPVARAPASLRGRLAQADPSAADQHPRQQPPPPQWYPVDPAPPQPRPPSQPPQMPEMASEPLPPDFERADGTHGRGRR